MTEPTYAQREKRAQGAAGLAERAFVRAFERLGIDPETITGSPLEAIAERQAARENEEEMSDER